MANVMYHKGRQHFLQGDLAWLSQTFKFVLVNASSYTPDTSDSGHEFLSDIPSGARVATSGALGSKTSTGGVANCANITVASVSGSQISYVVLYQDTGTAGTSDLVAIWDTATGLPVTPNGGDITIQIDTGANKLFVL